MSTETCRRSEEEILAFVSGDLAEPAALDVARHLAGCAGCRDAAVDFRALQELVPEGCACAALAWDAFETPFGRTYAAATAEGLVEITWRDLDDDAFVAGLEDRLPGHVVVREPGRLAEVERQLEEYFRGRRTRFELPVDLGALTAFQRRVLRETRRLGHGEVVPYAELARRVGRPRAYRAVGNALGRNPVPIVVPCHRVIRSDGSLGGYGGGLEYKRALFRIEGREDLLKAG